MGPLTASNIPVYGTWIVVFRNPYPIRYNDAADPARIDADAPSTVDAHVRSSPFQSPTAHENRYSIRDLDVTLEYYYYYYAYRMKWPLSPVTKFINNNLT